MVTSPCPASQERWANLAALGLCMVPFLATFDNVVTRKQRLRDEGARILKWMINGCLDYQKVGVAVPEKLEAATEAYLMQADDVLAFVDDCCVKDLAAKTTSRDLYGAFCTWCQDHGAPITVSRRAFTDRMIANGFNGAPGKRMTSTSTVFGKRMSMILDG
jgi:putative DNA primase/helicase